MRNAELSPACAILTLPSVNCAAVSVLDPSPGLFFFSSKTVVLTCGIVSAKSPLNKDLRLLMASRLAVLHHMASLLRQRQHIVLTCPQQVWCPRFPCGLRL